MGRWFDLPEEPTDDLDRWTQSGTGTATIETSGVFEGSECLQVESGATSGNEKRVYKEFDIPQRAQFLRVTGWVKWNDITQIDTRWGLIYMPSGSEDYTPELQFLCTTTGNERFAILNSAGSYESLTAAQEYYAASWRYFTQVLDLSTFRYAVTLGHTKESAKLAYDLGVGYASTVYRGMITFWVKTTENVAKSVKWDKIQVSWWE